jgi:hypothetical protein
LKFFGAPKCHELLENLESREATGFLRTGVLQKSVLVSFGVKGFETVLVEQFGTVIVHGVISFSLEMRFVTAKCVCWSRFLLGLILLPAA